MNSIKTLLLTITIATANASTQISRNTLKEGEEAATGTLGIGIIEGEEDASASEAPTDAQLPLNPFQFQEGCLRSFLGPENFPQKRVCNSDDDDNDDHNSKVEGLCSTPPFDYPEIRISNQDWDGPMISAWIMQIMLSELLRVPTTIETSSPDLHYNFYDPEGRTDASAATYPYWALRASKEAGGDCTKFKEGNKGGDYTPCAHVLPMAHQQGQASALQELRNEGVIDRVNLSGNADHYRWWIPKKYAKLHPSLLSFYGMGGDANRPMLAELFKRPMDWGSYCETVSIDGCNTKGDIAAHAPANDDEARKYFVDGSYTGHFAATDENNCTANPNTCTGHMVNVQCEWGTYAVPQAYHLNISVKSDGYLVPNGGYNYSSVIEIYAAANATGENVLLYWWEPDSLIERYRGTEYEFVPIHLPPPTTECVDNRVSEEGRCSANFTEQVGNSMGSCDTGRTPNVLPMTLEECETDEHGSCSPAYSALQSYQLTNLHLQQIYKYRSNDPNQDGRLAVCRWFAENLETFKKTVIPKTYPRQPRDEVFYQPLTYFSIGLAVFCMLVISICVFGTKKFEKAKVMIYAQVDFLLMILAGLFLVAISALLYSIAPTKAVCIMRNWFVAVGYSLELIPLAVKVAAINRVVRKSNKCKRVTMQKRVLYRLVGGCIAVVCVYLAVWTAVDPAIPQTKTILSENKPENDDEMYMVEVSKYCASSSNMWQIATSVYLLVLLLVSTAIATQNRGIREEFNETRYLTIMIYSHFMFTILRLVVFLIRDNFSRTNAVSATTSILLSLDTLITICIYFLPKLRAGKKAAGINNGGIGTRDPKMFVWNVQTNDNHNSSAHNSSAHNSDGANLTSGDADGVSRNSDAHSFNKREFEKKDAQKVHKKMPKRQFVTI